MQKVINDLNNNLDEYKNISIINTNETNILNNNIEKSKLEVYK